MRVKEKMQPSVVHLPFPSACLCLHGLIFQELVRLRGDTHGQLRDGGRGGDVHQTRLSTLHLGTVSESCVSASLCCFLSLWTLTNGVQPCSSGFLSSVSKKESSVFSFPSVDTHFPALPLF